MRVNDFTSHFPPDSLEFHPQDHETMFAFNNKYVGVCNNQTPNITRRFIFSDELGIPWIGDIQDQIQTARAISHGCQISNRKDLLGVSRRIVETQLLWIG